MHKWKGSAIIFLCLDGALILVGVDEYYEFFVKKCRDAFPFGYCPWGSESMGLAWRSADAYLAGLINGLCVLVFFLFVSLYCFYKKKYGWALFFSIVPLIINRIWAWLE